MKDNAVSAEWFSGRARIQITESRNNNSFTANFRMRKDSVMWFSISPLLGIEVARVLISRDSIKVIDRLNKTASLYSYDSLRTYIPYPVDFYMLQSMMLGNIIFYNEKNIASGIQDSVYMLTSETEQIKNTIFLNRDFLPVKSSIQDKTNSHEMNVTLGDYRNGNNKMFAFKRLVEIWKGEKITISMDFEKARFDEPVDFPFAIKEKNAEGQ